MRPFVLFCCVTVLAGCTKSDDRSVGAGTTSDTADAAADVATVSLSDFAGTWKVLSTDWGGANPVETELRATADTSGWILVGPDRKSYPVRVVAVAGDSIITESGPRPSFLRKGAKVTTRTVYRLQGDRLVGSIESRFKIDGRDSTGQRVSAGTRIR
jgi:hypothetical protein